MIGLITSLLPVVSNVLDRVLPDTVEKDKVKAELKPKCSNTPRRLNVQQPT